MMGCRYKLSGSDHEERAQAYGTGVRSLSRKSSCVRSISENTIRC